MGIIANLIFLFTIILILILLRQYLDMWIILDRKGYKFLKYVLPIMEISLFIFIDELFLLPSVMCFLFLIYKGRIFEDGTFRTYYTIDKGKFLLNKKHIIIVIFISPIVFFFSHMLLNMFVNGINNIDKQVIDNMTYYDLFKQKHIIDYLTLFGVTCIIAPIVEEFSFRVLIYENWLANYFNKKIYALFVSSLIFAFSHFDINTVVYTFLISLILCLIYDFTGYIGAVLLHMLLNLYTIIGISYIKLTIKTIIIVLCILIIYLSLFLLNKAQKGKTIKDSV